MNSVKITAAALFLALLAPLLAACGDSDDIMIQPGGEITPETTAETAPQRQSPDLPDKDWEGREFIVLGRTHNTYSQFVNFEIAAEEMNGEIVNDAVYTRNSRISEKYNVIVKQILVEYPETELPKYVNAGDDVINASFHSIQTIGPLAAAGYFMDFYTLPHIDFTKPWWYPEVNGALSVGGKLYMTTSQLNMMDKNRTYSMCFNKDMAGEFGLGNLYDIVRSGEWTVEKMTAMCKTVTADIDGDGKMTDLDRWGYVMDSRNAFYVAVAAMDNRVVVKNKEDIPVFSVMNERMSNSIDLALALCRDNNISFICEDFQGKVDYDFWGASSKVFADRAGALFTTSFTHMLKSYSARCDFDYGVLPYPKYDELQEKYYSVPDPVAAAVFTVPKTNADPSFPGFMLELLSAESMYDVMPLYIEVSAKTKYTYDEESAEMLDISFNNLIFDLGIIYNWGGFSDVFRSTIPLNRKNELASIYASSESKALTAMEKTVADFLALE